MDTRNKILVGAFIGVGVAALTALATYKYLKSRKVRFVSGDDDDVVYVLLDGDDFEGGKKHKFSSRKKAM